MQAEGVAAALAKPDGQRGIHNREGMLWILIDPAGRKHAAINLREWCRTNRDAFFPDEEDNDRIADRIRSGFTAVAASMRGIPSRAGHPVPSYKGWQLARLPLKIDGRCAGAETVKMLDMWLNGASINSICKALGTSAQKINKTLISVGLLDTDEARLFRTGLTVDEIASRLGVSTRHVEGHIPYSKGTYMRENPTANALRIRKSREKGKKND